MRPGHIALDFRPENGHLMPTRTADLAKCQGYAICVVTAPDLFDLDDEGTVVMLKQHVSDDEAAHAEEAVASCPAVALALLR